MLAWRHWDLLLAGFIAASVITLVAAFRLWRRLGTRRFVVSLLWLAGVIGAVVLVIRVGGCADPPDKPELARSGSKLVHAYGFELLAPPATMTPDDALASSVGNGYTSCSAWQSPGAELVVCGLEQEIHSRAELDADVAAIRRGIDRAATSLRASIAISATANQAVSDSPRPGTDALETMAASFAQWSPDDVSWNRNDGSARLSATYRGATIRVHLITARGGVALAWSIASSSSQLADVIESLSRTVD